MIVTALVLGSISLGIASIEADIRITSISVMMVCIIILSVLVSYLAYSNRKHKIRIAELRKKLDQLRTLS